ncbi:helix-turn-helix domain-containing protein [Schleiferilactobacillus shenzhenensis]|uniref:YqaE n=1 Tax=Schleiferilactobacillus shenzhenensis LY-73 TaxID=1231336 RepID=U4TNZ8_9LACO|nr:transcriptional regulator [Schleiferilactobacillus shenzhenensis]ERL65934.1 YqaE [Schleiferilactobacillus shenzhenensis LY-73]
MDIGNQIKRRRKALGLTQEQLAAQLNVSRSAVSNWEAGRNYPDLLTVIALSDALDLSLDNLLKGDNNMIQKVKRDAKTKHIKTAVIAGLCLLVLLLCGLFVQGENQPHDIAGQDVKAVTITDGTLHIALPVYRSISSWMVNNSFTSTNTIQLSMDSRPDLSFKHRQKMDLTLQPSLSNGKYLQILNHDGKVTKTIKLQ